MEKKRVLGRQHSLIGSCDHIWYEIFSYLTPQERFGSRRVCCSFKRVLKLPGAWKHIRLPADEGYRVVRALKKLAQDIQPEFCYLCIRYDTPTFKLFAEIGFSKFITKNVRELDVMDFMGQHATMHEWFEERSLAPCYGSLTSLTIPHCIAIEQLDSLVQLRQLRHLRLARDTLVNCTSCAGRFPLRLESAYKRLAAALGPGIESAEFNENCPYADVPRMESGLLASPALYAVMYFVPSCKNIKRLVVEGSNATKPVALDFPCIEELDLSGVVVTSVSQAAAQSVKVMKFRFAQLPTAAQIPVLTKLVEFDFGGYTDTYASARAKWLLVQTLFSQNKMPQINRLAVDFGVIKCDLVGPNIAERYKEWAANNAMDVEVAAMCRLLGESPFTVMSLQKAARLPCLRTWAAERNLLYEPWPNQQLS